MTSWAHNPKVGGSNPPPATNAIIGLRALRVSDAGPKRSNKRNLLRRVLEKGLPTAVPFLFCSQQGRTKCHARDFAVRLPLGRHQCVAIDVHCG